MQRYINSLSVDSVVQVQKKLDWETYKKLNLEYSDATPYFSLVMEQEILLDKKLPNPRGDVYIRQWLTSGLQDCYDLLNKDDDYVKSKYYRWYVGNKYAEFSKNWKPNDVQDEGLNFMFVTLNYKQGTDMSKVKLDTARILNLPVLSNSKITYCFENYTDTSNHPHVHCLIELNRTGTVPMSKLLEKIYQDKKLCDYLAVDVKFSWAKTFDKRCQKRSVCLAYISGNKIDKKLENIENDKIWRLENNLDEIYFKENK